MQYSIYYLKLDKPHCFVNLHVRTVYIHILSHSLRLSHQMCTFTTYYFLRNIIVVAVVVNIIRLKMEELRAMQLFQPFPLNEVHLMLRKNMKPLIYSF